MTSMIDPNLKKTTYSYSDRFTGCSPSGGPYSAYLTQINHPITYGGVPHIESFTYGYKDGQLTSAADQNGQTTHYKYGLNGDTLDRLGEVDYPDGGKTTFTYNDTPYNGGSTPSTTTTQTLGAAGNKVTIDSRDGLGHVINTNVNSTIYVHTAYDGAGHGWCKSYPYGSSTFPACGSSFPGDTFTYDALGRTKTVGHPDNTSLTYNYAGSSTETIDEMGISRVTQTDGLGRLAFVCEEATANLQFGADRNYTNCVQDVSQSLPQRTGFVASYQYDVSDNLLDVHQSNQQQDRQFTYDSLSRLKTASNPESGTAYYSYDSNGNLVAETHPAPNQTNPGVNVATVYSYDSLDRVIRKTYSDGVTPEVDFVYDQASASIGSAQYSLSNVNGRLAYAFSPNSTIDIYSYDPMGRTTDAWQCIAAPCAAAWHAHHTYDLAGDLASLGYNGAATLNYSYDSLQRLSGATSSGSGLSNLSPTLLSNVSYYPVGMHTATLGNGLAEDREYNSRTWLSSLTVGSSGSVYSLGLGYAGDGDVTSANDCVNGVCINGNWSYGYDAFNRLATAQTPPTNPTLAYSYSYDRFGNRWSQAVTVGSGWQMPLSFNSNNQISTSGYRYDAAGNVMMDIANCYSYDGENRLSSVAPQTFPGSGVCGATTMSYLYDPAGRRVAKLQGGAIQKEYFYDAGGHMLTEANGSGSTLRAEFYSGDRHLATWASSATYFNHADWLGTERARSDAGGNRCETITSLPFGDGESIAGGCGGGDPSPNHFTGKQRDTESASVPGGTDGLDYFGARYYASSAGRFLNPDWADKPTAVPYAHFGNPQSLNLYGYVLNNPSTFADPDGHCDNFFCNVAAGIAIGTGKFLWNSSPLGQSVNTIRQSIQGIRNPAAAQARATGQLKAAGTMASAVSGNPVAQAQVAIAAVNTWNAMSTTDKASAVTQIALGVGTAIAGGYAASASGAAGEMDEAHSVTSLLNLNKSLASEGQMGEAGEAIIGAGTNKALTEGGRLAREYGGNAAGWSKMSSSSYKASDGSMVETHWYQNDAINSGKIEPKTKIDPN